MNDINILMVDDNEDDYLLVSQYLKRSQYYSYNVTYESQKEMALEKMLSKNNGFDLYLIDYMLGSFTGLELITEARNDGFEGIVVLFTGNDDTFIHDKAMKIGVREFINKNEITPGMLERTIRYVFVNKENDDLLKKTIIEKDLLIKEIIKKENKNIEYIQNLLSLSIRENEDEKIKTILKELKEKISPIRIPHSG